MTQTLHQINFTTQSTSPSDLLDAVHVHAQELSSIYIKQIVQDASGRINRAASSSNWPLQRSSLGALWPTCGPFGTLWDLANCVTVVFGASGLPLGTFKLCNGRLWEPLGTLKLCNCRLWEHCDPPRVPSTPFGTLLDAVAPHLAAFGPLPIHLCDV